MTIHSSFPELLAPAGNLEKLRAAFFYGADAVYLGGASSDGGPALNLRASCEGFDAAELAEGLLLARSFGGKVYYCLNSLPREEDLRRLPAVIEEAAALGVHAFIIADPGVLRLARSYAPSVPVHLSTQANTANSESARFWADQGVGRVNLARELHCGGIQSVRAACPDVELEVFVHGAMCLAVSGQCLLSGWLNDRPANAGRCTQPCRFEYRAFEERLRPGAALWSVTEEQGFSDIWAPDDLCLLPYLPSLIQTGVDALKIEGRMKGPGYVAHVTDVYSTALAALRREYASVAGGAFAENGRMEAGFFTGHASSAFGRKDSHDFEMCAEEAEHQAAAFAWERYMPDLLLTASRPLSSGFFLPGRRRSFSAEYLASLGLPEDGAGSSFAHAAQPLLAKVVEPVDGSGGGRGWHMELRGSWRDDMDAEVMLPGLRRPVLEAGSYALENHRGERAASMGSGIRGVLYTDSPEIVPGCFIRMAVNPTGSNRTVPE